MATDAAALALPASRGGLSVAPARQGAALRRLAGVGVLVLLVLACVLRSALGTRLDSFTVDEPWHIVAGTRYVRTGDFHLNPEHPPLAKLWTGAAMPADFRLPPVTLRKWRRSFRAPCTSRSNPATPTSASATRRPPSPPAAVRWSSGRCPGDARLRAPFEAQIARLRSGADPRMLQPLRNPWLE